MTEEEKEQWIKEYCESINKRNEKMKKMMSSTKYIQWLIKFTKDKEGFSDDDWLYFPEKINDTDKENVEMLSLFYKGIEKYAEKNYIYPTPCSFGNYYKVRFNKYGFEIGILIGQGTVFFCNKTPIENENDFIDFFRIMIGKDQNNTKKTKASLDSLSQTIINIHESGIPIEAIIETIDNTIEKISFKEEIKSKKLIKSEKNVT